MAEYILFTIKAVLVALFAIVITGYVYFVWSGDLPNPFSQLPSISTINSTGAAVISIAIGICCLLAAIAPFIYAVRSGDIFTVVVSIVALVACFTILTLSRTIIDMVLAAIVYFTSAFISVVMFATARIAKEIRGAKSTTDPIIESDYSHLPRI